MSRRIRLSGIHLLSSACVALLIGLLVFVVWYPPPYATLAGGTTLLAMLLFIDVVLGPCLTALVANPGKLPQELRRDISCIVLVQILAMSYGLYVIALARPIHMVFEVDRLTVVNAADVDSRDLVKASEPYRRLPWTGPTLIAARTSTSQQELINSINLGIQGVDISMQPDRWVDYYENRAMVVAAVRPIQALINKYPQMRGDVERIAARRGVSIESIGYLPVTSRRVIWTALVSLPTAQILGYLPVDGFF
jgi:hypothetical protein